MSFIELNRYTNGDTVVLEDGRKIRLLGINTPEVQHKDKMADAGGEDAKTWLINKLQHARIRLEFDLEKTDKYGRTLAHLFSEKKEHINLSLVKAGLAEISIYPLICCTSMSCLQPRIRQNKTDWAFGNDQSMPQYPLTILLKWGIRVGRAWWARLLIFVIPQSLFTWCFPAGLKHVSNANGNFYFLMLMIIWVKFSKSVVG